MGVALLLWVLAAGRSVAQDIHFSQADYIQVLTNPAYSGFFDGQGRFGIIYRNQWATVHDPFQTIAATVEVPVYQNKYHRYGLALGGYVYADKAGSLSYGTISGDLIFSFYKALNTRNDNIFSLAVMGGFNHAGFDPSNALMEDPSEQFEREHINYPTVGAGAAFYSQLNNDLTMKIGIAAYNLNRPKLTYFVEDNTRLEMRFNAYLRFEWRFAPQWSLMPLAMAQIQKKNTEVLFGTDAKYFIDESYSRNLALQFGAAYRWADALVFDIALHYNALSFFFLYDANLSKLAPASKSVGAFEIGLIYHLNHKKAKRKALPCPII